MFSISHQRSHQFSITFPSGASVHFLIWNPDLRIDVTKHLLTNAYAAEVKTRLLDHPSDDAPEDEKYHGMHSEWWNGTGHIYIFEASENRVVIALGSIVLMTKVICTCFSVSHGMTKHTHMYVYSIPDILPGQA